MTSISRAALGTAAAVALLGTAVPADACSAETSTMASSVEMPTASVDDRATNVDDVDPLGVDEAGDGGSALAPIVAFGALVAVLILGLRAIRNQRRSGTRRRFPPIG